MRVNLPKHFGEFCLDCGYISVRNHFRCKECKGGNTTEQQYTRCPDEDCNRKIRVKDLAEHLAKVHPSEIAEYFVDHVIRLYDRHARTDQIRTRTLTKDRVHERRERRLPGEDFKLGGHGLHKTRKF